MIEAKRLEAQDAGAALPRLSDILVDCVDHGASVSFMKPFSPADALGWWEGVASSVAAGRVVLFGAWLNGELIGTAQLIPADKPNQPHRADVAKVLVHSSARKRGAGGALMQAVEAEARRLGLTLLTLDTAEGAAARLYARSGWTAAGTIPGYALWPDGGLCDTVIFYKRLS